MTQLMWKRVVAMKKKGLPVKEIAYQLGTTDNSVRATLSRYMAQQKRIAVYVEGDVRKKLLKAARQRGVKPDVLASRLLSVVAQDDMFNAVLDDAA